jgi:hypothetical protein
MHWLVRVKCPWLTATDRGNSWCVARTWHSAGARSHLITGSHRRRSVGVGVLLCAGFFRVEPWYHDWTELFKTAGGAPGGRTLNQRIKRSTLVRSARLTCNDATSLLP